MKKFLLVSMLAVFALSAGPATAKGLMGGGGFKVYSPDDAGGGWVLHDFMIGTTLWGCADVLKVDDCKPVALPDWVPGTKLKFIHISEDSQAAWLQVSAGPWGDFLMACYDPEGEPNCKSVELELRPPLVPGIERVWPDYDNLPAAAAAGGGGPMKGLMGGAPDLPASAIIADKSKGNMWLSASNKVPGPVNLYACRNLESDPECELAIPDWFHVDREDLGFKKVSVDERPYEADGVESAAIILEDIDEGSAAEEAKLRVGDVVVKVEGFRLKSDKHFKGLIRQFPATYSFTIELDSGEKITVDVRRKPSKEEKESSSSSSSSRGRR